MKRLLAMLLTLMLLCSAAIAEEGLAFEISGIAVHDEWAGETSNTHKWIVVNGTLTNWDIEELQLDEQMSGGLVFKGKYAFDAQVEFGMDAIEPLVQAEGALVFRVPNIVAEASGEALDITLTLQGKALPLSTEEVSSTSVSKNGKLEGPGFDSPQAAVKAYVEAFNRGDLPGMIATFAIETYMDNVDTQAYVERLKSAIYTIAETIPIGNEYFRNVKVAKRYGSIADALYYQYLFHNTPEAYAKLADGKPLYGSELGEITDYIAAMSDVPMTGWFGKIELVQFLEPGDLHDLYWNETNQKNISKLRVALGCDELAEAPVLLNIDGEEYLLCMQCARYGDRWFNNNLIGNVSNLLGLSTYTGGLEPYADLLEENY